MKIPTDEAQDEAEKRQCIQDYLSLFQEELEIVNRQGRKKEMKAKVFKKIRKVGQIVTEHDNAGNPREWNFQFVLRDQRVIVMTTEEAIGHYKLAIAFVSNMQRWPER